MTQRDHEVALAADKPGRESPMVVYDHRMREPALPRDTEGRRRGRPLIALSRGPNGEAPAANELFCMEDRQEPLCVVAGAE
jgi:hypothetical protein